METILRLLAENPESLGEVVKTYVTKYKEPVYDVLKELMIIAKDYSENTEYPAIQARIKKNMFDAYVNVGFTEDQALALMINDNIQLMKNIQKSVNNTSVKNGKWYMRLADCDALLEKWRNLSEKGRIEFDQVIMC